MENRANKAYLEPNEILRLIESADNLRDRLLLLSLLHLGCRISEALAISVEDIDLSNRTVMIKHLKSRIKLKCPKCHVSLGLASVYCPKCGHKVEDAVEELKEHREQRVLPLSRELKDMLQDYISRGGPVNRGGKQLLFGINRHRAWRSNSTGSTPGGGAMVSGSPAGGVCGLWSS
ncbi:MAG: tyrosine-type recombinase/integrase [Dehalogenimonas sp.]